MAPPMLPDSEVPAEPVPEPVEPPSEPAAYQPLFTRLMTFGRLEAVSFVHSCIYTALLVCAFVLNKPEPATFVLGLSHGLLWIGMSLTCIAATRWRVIPYWLAVCVAVLGGLGPFFGSLGFIYEFRRRRRRSPATR
jgi:hypothetical protein